MSALSDLENLRLHDIEDGDVRDDPRWRELVGYDPVKAFLAEMAAKHLPGQHNQESHGHDHGVDVIPGDKLKLAGRIPLGSGESLVGSDVFESGGGAIPLALTSGPGGRRLRIGTGIDPADKKRWAGRNLGQTANLDEGGIRQLRSALDDMRIGGDEGGKRFRGLEKRADELDQQRRDIIMRQHRNLSKSDAKRLDRLDRRLEQIDGEMSGAEETMRRKRDYIANEEPDSLPRWQAIDAEIASLDPDVDQHRIEQLQMEQARMLPSPAASTLRAMRAPALLRQEREELELERQGLTANPTPLSDQDRADLSAVEAEIAANQSALAQMEESILVEGVVAGEWADLVYEVTTAETTYEYDNLGISYRIGARPHDAGDDWDLTEDYGATEFEPGDLIKLAAMLDRLTGTQSKSFRDTQGKHLRGRHDQRDHGRGRRSRVVAAVGDAVGTVTAATEAVPQAAKPPKRPRQRSAPAIQSAPSPTRSGKGLAALIDGDHPTEPKISDIAKTKYQAITGDAAEEIRGIFEGQYGDFKVTDVDAKIVNGGPGNTGDEVDGHRGLWVEGYIQDAQGRHAGFFVHIFHRNEKGELVAHHRHQEIVDKDLQGQGFLRKFNGRLIAEYRADGFKKVTLHANIDVGGYAQAREGFDFASSGEMAKVFGRLDTTVKYPTIGHPFNIPAARLKEQLQLGREMLQRMRSDDPPAAIEVAGLGRWKGAGRNDWWIGKATMMGSSWKGELLL